MTHTKHTRYAISLLAYTNQYQSLKELGYAVEWATSANDPDVLGVDKTNIFIGGLNPQEITEELLTEKFEIYGEISDVKVINREHAVNSVSSRSAYAFIKFVDAESATAAMENEVTSMFTRTQLVTEWNSVARKEYSRAIL